MFFTVMPMYVCLFWSIMLALQLFQEGRSRHRIHLLVFMMAASMLYFGHCVFFSHGTSILPITDTLYCTANLAVYPLYYLYICSLTTRKDTHDLRWLMLIPAALGGISVGTVYLLMSEEECIRFINSYMYEGQRAGLTGLPAWQSFIHDVCKAFFAVIIIPVFFQGRKHIKQYDQLVTNVYADIEDKTLTTLHGMLVAFILTSLASFVFNLIGRHHFTDSIWLLLFPSVLFSILLFSIGYVGYRQRFSIEDVEMDEYQADSSASEEKAITDLRHQIEELMKKEQLYRQPNLKIVDLVQRLGSNRNYVYRAINRDMGISFNEYINKMRIEYASQLINQRPDCPIAEVAEQSGFASSTSFYRNFKLYKGMGPKEYQNKLKGEG